MYSYIYYSGGQQHCCSYRSVSFSINNSVFDEFAAQFFFFPLSFPFIPYQAATCYTNFSPLSPLALSTLCLTHWGNSFCLHINLTVFCFNFVLRRLTNMLHTKHSYSTNLTLEGNLWNLALGWALLSWTIRRRCIRPSALRSQYWLYTFPAFLVWRIFTSTHSPHAEVSTEYYTYVH